MSAHPSTPWHPHPDTNLEEAISTAGTLHLEALLRHPMVVADRYAHLRILDRLCALRPGDPAILAGWVQAMLLSNRPAQVWSVARDWPYEDEREPAWTLIAAQVAQAMGEADEARARYRWLLERHPTMVDAWQKYIDFEDPARLESADVVQVESLYDDTTDPYVREKAAFALAGHHSRQSPGRAFLLACEAHRLKRQRLGNWEVEPLDTRLEADQQRQPLQDAGGPAPRPIFVVGLPRSGTTVLAGLFDSHSRIAGLGEQNLIPAVAATACRNPHDADPRLPAFVRAWYRAAVGDLANGASAVVDKLPANIEYIGLILSMFPDALVVHLERELADCAMSIHLRDFEFGCRYADDAADLARYADRIDRHARHWKERAPDRVLPLRYEALVRDPRSALAPILSAAGLSWETDMLEFWRQRQQVATFSEGQVRQPLHGNSVGGWRRFLPEAEDYLRTLGIAV